MHVALNDIKIINRYIYKEIPFSLKVTTVMLPVSVYTTHHCLYCNCTLRANCSNISTHNFSINCSVRTVATVKGYDVTNGCTVGESDWSPLEC